MIKRLTVAVAALFVLAGQAFGAGTIPGFSLTPQFDLSGKVTPSCKLYVIQAGTTQTPQNAYQDTGLTNVLPNPLTCDATGRLPQWFVADGLIKVRLTDKNGVQLFIGDNLLVVGPSSGGGGGGGTIDPTTIMATGDMKSRYGTGVLTGFVRANGRTIGSATSGATERANSDAQALFEYLWNTDGNLAVSTGRGVSSNADWVANKTITLPDWSGRALAFLDDMGAGARGVLTSTYFGADPTVLGQLGGSQSHVQTTAELASHNHINTASVNDPGHNHQFPYTAATPPAGGTPLNGVAQGATGQVTTSTSVTGITVTMNNAFTGGNAASPTVTPSKLATLYLKL